ncbi:tRNA (guanosine(46)-N7)-methyltransferase TrmB [Mariniplasma anaerobium]|uniref:tRNA (guanine-N(7)-)-methyltransferase n=1 Tax=Mariniplasma anaerobium TaxID=2735436 RepID=A0A7U9TLB8_9MOLU|nr:tRNA (guanosine(46)-N7)-methyltransferase TrmB [Mariniplasma anaerobium]BCR36044.1 tRNA (guanine-N(7)-)-methyltransferase [Mariniplasma anaerobium]
MRQKRLKYVNIDLLQKHGVITKVEALDLPKDKSIFLEIGSGKGQFITSMAKDHPDDLFIAMEVNLYVIYRVLEKKMEMKIDNLIILLADAKYLETYFSKTLIDGVYLNFSDPWPKVKHHKRRLTYPTFLKLYQKLLKPNAKLQFRTDHKDLFLDSVEYIKPYFDLIDITHDLAPSTYMTEYEVKKRPLGPIYQLIGEYKDVK